MNETAKPVHRIETIIQCPHCNGQGQMRPMFANQATSSGGFVECSGCFGRGTIVVVEEISYGSSQP